MFLFKTQFHDGSTAPGLIKHEARLADLRRKINRVAYFTPSPTDTSFLYRAFNMVQAINSLDSEVSASYFFEKDILEHGVEFLDGLVALILVRCPNTSPVQELVEAAKKQNIKVFYDLDEWLLEAQDLPIDLSRNSESPSAQLYQQMIENTDSYRAAIQLCDEVITPTEILAELVTTATGLPSSTLPSFLNAQQLWHAQYLFDQKASSGFNHHDSKFTLGYFRGTPLDGDDFGLLLPSLRQTLSRDSRVDLQVLESLWVKKGKQLPSSKTRLIPQITPWTLQNEMAACHYHVAPLQNRIFSDAAQEIAFMESSILGCPILASPTPHHIKTITHGVSGFLAPSHLWAEVIDEALQISRLRYIEMALACRKSALERYAFCQFPHRILETLGLKSPPSSSSSLPDKTPSLRSHYTNENEPVAQSDKISVLIRGVEQPVYLQEVRKVESIHPPLQALRHCKFSIILPTHNRKYCVGNAIDSILSQTLQTFEIIIIDDRSSDGTFEFLQQKYPSYMEDGTIVYRKLERASGVCAARNFGLTLAKNDWICYVDSDNQIVPHCLETYARAILENPAHLTFYSVLKNVWAKSVIARTFDYSALSQANFIDLGVFVHHRNLYLELGGFDENLKRLVDWELALNYTKKFPPIFINQTLLLYNDQPNDTRISTHECLTDAKFAVQRKYNFGPCISVVILTYNHKNFIAKAIESALMQHKRFPFEIIISDDGSTDETQEIIRSYEELYPNVIRNISNPINQGISANFKRCFEAAKGDYIAVLEGDDYWTDKRKLTKQAEFLIAHPTASMVFSMIEARNIGKSAGRTLERQEVLNKTLLTGEDWFNDYSLNLIANFSSSMFRAEIVKNLPETLYDPRLSEIPLAFYLETLGPIGFIKEVHSTYITHAAGVWSGASKKARYESGLKVRKTALELCAPQYRERLAKIIRKNYEEPLEKLRQDESLVLG